MKEGGRRRKGLRRGIGTICPNCKWSQDKLSYPSRDTGPITKWHFLGYHVKNEGAVLQRSLSLSTFDCREQVPQNIETFEKEIKEI